ncbi:MAG: protein kinase [Mogibacterium sp.]|nr:protein kinase [Mogibacterium sp.]
MLRIGDLVGGTYQILEEIGHGGTGVVYLAYHNNLQKHIVLKRVTKQIRSMEALRRETDILKNLRHSGIPKIYDFIIENGEVFTAMDYIEGVSFDKYMLGANYHREDIVIKWLRELTDILVYLEGCNPAIIHSDIKPENIIITPQGAPVLIDFNISIDADKESQAAGFSKSFASPEQAYMVKLLLSGQAADFELDSRTDIYSLGAVFYQLVSGIEPNSEYILPKLETMQGLNYSQALLTLIDRCVEWSRDRRFRNASLLASSIRHLYRLNRDYRKFMTVKLASWTLSAAVFATGCYCAIHGMQLNNAEAAAELYTEIANYTQMGDFASAGSAANELVSRRGCYKQLDAKRQAEIHHAIADSEYIAENYDIAAIEYEKAIDILKRSGENDKLSGYYSDLGIAYLKCGDTDACERLAAECMNENIASDELDLIRAASEMQKGNTAEAIKIADETYKNTADNVLKAKACIIASQSLGDNQIGEKLKYLRKATEYSDEKRYISECAALEYEYAGRPGISDFERKNSALNAARLYESLCKSASPRLSDRINMGISYYYAGEYQKAIDALSKATKISDDYAIDMYLALAYEKSGDMGYARKYCADAMNKCKNDNRFGSKEDLEILKELSDRLYKN